MRLIVNPADGRIAHVDAINDGIGLVNIYADAAAFRCSQAPLASFQVRATPADYDTLSDAAETVLAQSWDAFPALVPQQVTRYQALAALYGAGLLTTVESAVANSGDPLLKLAYDNALSFERQSPMVLGLASALGLTDAQLDALFTTASQIT